MKTEIKRKIEKLVGITANELELDGLNRGIC